MYQTRTIRLGTSAGNWDTIRAHLNARMLKQLERGLHDDILYWDRYAVIS